jgi:hypothetical protein
MGLCSPRFLKALLDVRGAQRPLLRPTGPAAWLSSISDHQEEATENASSLPDGAKAIERWFLVVTASKGNRENGFI